MTTLFDNLFENVDIQEPTNEVQETQDSTEQPAPEPVAEPEPTESAHETQEPSEPVVETKAPKASALTADDIRQIYQEEETRKAQAIKSQEAAREAARAKLEQDLAAMPDPVQDITGFKKWQIEREQALEQSYQARLNQDIASRNFTQEMDTLNKTLQSTHQGAIDKYGKDTVRDAEAWATQIINQNPEYANYVKNNPSYEYVTKEYLKFKEREAFERDPDQFIRDKISKLQNEKAEPRDTKKVPPKSISSVKSASDPQPEVPAYLKGLF